MVTAPPRAPTTQGKSRQSHQESFRPVHQIPSVSPMGPFLRKGHHMVLRSPFTVFIWKAEG